VRIDPPAEPWDEPIDSHVFRAPPQFVDEQHEGRLIRELRAAAKLRDPDTILAWSATEFFKSARARTREDAEVAKALATAMADLAASGRASYEKLHGGVNMLAIEGTTRLRIEARVGPPAATDDEIASAMSKALDRAFAVAWALRGPVAQRPALRGRLGWIAVSAEDDMPHRPVNMPAPPYEQFEVRVRTRGATGGDLWLSTRYFVANAVDDDALALATVPVATRRAPNNPIPNIPADHEVLLFLHGHSSGAEEALAIVPHLLEQGLRRGKRFSVLSFDLPNNGYSETFAHASVAAPEATTFPFWATDNHPIATPVLDYIEDFVVAFVDAVEDVLTLQGMPRVKDRIAAVFGGSLGGNLGFRLGRRANPPPWLQRAAIVAWSPASVWKAMVKAEATHEGPRVARDNYRDAETDDSRKNYFADVYDRDPWFPILKRQSAYWYRKGFPGTDTLIAMSRAARREIYNAHFRQWHWRVACEQLIYSHAENEVYGDGSTPVRYTQNRLRMLLAAGQVDNYTYTGIYNNTRTIGRAMTKTPGRLLLVDDTGHSIHIERPQFFAGEIVKFLVARPMEIRCVTRRAGRIIRVGGINRATLEPFDLTQQECIAAISAGDDFFVADAAGNVAAVIVGQMHVAPGPGGEIRYYIKTEADGVEPNNLASLPAC
jgi:pimeloyl-ACP methyl ester carboxylesterase